MERNFLRELDGESNREPKMLKMERNLLRELNGDSNRESKIATLLEMLLSFKSKLHPPYNNLSSGCKLIRQLVKC